MNQANDPRAIELLPWYANGTLSPHERAAVERALSRSEAVRLELDFWLHVAREVERERTGLDEGGIEIGWARLRSQLRERRVMPRFLGVAPGAQSNRWRLLAAAAVLGTIGVQALMLYRFELANRAEIRQLDATTNVKENEWRIQMRFRATANADAIQALLLQIDARIVDGPSALGVYELAVPMSTRFADARALAAWLGTQPIVEQSTAPP